jgi:maltose alpha-D-glucosyltransferase/alpha-amylase
MKRLIALRKRFKAFGRGTVEVLHPENRKILVFLRRYHEERILVVANLSRFTQWTELDLSAFAGTLPIEVFGGLEFPPIREQPYPLTLGPHTFYWFLLEPRRETAALRPPLTIRPPTLTRTGPWETLFQGSTKGALEALLPDHLLTCRWFGGKVRPLRAVELTEVIPLPDASPAAFLTLLTVTYTEGEAETYLVPLLCATGAQADRVQKELPQAIIARVRGEGEQGCVYEAFEDNEFYPVLLDAIARRRCFRGRAGKLEGRPTRTFNSRNVSPADLTPSLLQTEQNNTVVAYGERFILKLFCHVAAGMHPDFEIRSFLAEKAGFTHTPAVAGTLAYHPSRGEPIILAVLQHFVQNQGNAWDNTLSVLVHYFEAARSLHEPAPPPHQKPWFTLQAEEIPLIVKELIGPYLEVARLLGQRTAELHLALGSDMADPNFAPEPFSVLHYRSRYQFLRILSAQAFQLLRQCLKSLPELVRGEARNVLNLEATVGRRLHSVFTRKISTWRIRCHGSYHLGQLLYTGDDVVILGFGGEPLRPLSERRLKHPPMKDVASMLRSFHYAVYTGLFNQITQGKLTDRQSIAALGPWAHWWWQGVSTVFLDSYLTTVGKAAFLSLTRDERQVLLDVYLLEKAFYELGYELHNRPDWVRIPLQGIRQLVGAGRE